MTSELGRKVRQTMNFSRSYRAGERRSKADRDVDCDGLVGRFGALANAAGIMHDIRAAGPVWSAASASGGA
jgi:hypothetical protein